MRPAADGDTTLGRIVAGRGLRAFADGLIAILLPLYLGQLGYSPVEVGVVARATLPGSALPTLALGFTAHRFRLRRGLPGAALLMVATGLGLASLTAVWPLLLVAFAGTLNPSGGDVSVFLPLEHSLIAHSVPDQVRTAAYARYSFIGSVGAAVGSLAAGSFDWIRSVLPPETAARSLFFLYAAIGLATLLLYAGLPDVEAVKKPTAALGRSRRRVFSLAALFAVDAFGGGFIINAMLALWLFERFGLSASAAGAIFFATGLCAATLDDTATVRSYESLTLVEQPCRFMKTIDRHVRPIYHWSADRVRAHVCLCMPAYYLEWHMLRKLARRLFDDADKRGRRNRAARIVAGAQRSPTAIAKQITGLTPNGLPVHGFRTLLADLASLARNTIATTIAPDYPLTVLTRATPIQRKALQLLRLAV